MAEWVKWFGNLAEEWRKYSGAAAAAGVAAFLQQVAKMGLRRCGLAALGGRRFG